MVGGISRPPRQMTVGISRPDRRAAAAVLSPAALGRPTMTVTPEGPPQIRFPRNPRTVGQFYQLWRYGFAMMPSVDDLEMRWGSMAPTQREAALLYAEGYHG